jgi:hypothetical protein
MKQLIYVGTERGAIFTCLEEAKAWQNKTHGSFTVCVLVKGQVEEAFDEDEEDNEEDYDEYNEDDDD